MIILSIYIGEKKCQVEILSPTKINETNLIEYPQNLYISTNSPEISIFDDKNNENINKEGYFDNIQNIMSDVYNKSKKKTWLNQINYTLPSSDCSYRLYYYETPSYCYKCNNEEISLTATQILAKYIRCVINDISKKYNQNINDIIIKDIKHYRSSYMKSKRLPSSCIYCCCLAEDMNVTNHKKNCVAESYDYLIALILLYADWIEDKELYLSLCKLSSPFGYYCDFLNIDINNEKIDEKIKNERILKFHIPDQLYNLYRTNKRALCQIDIHKFFFNTFGIDEKIIKKETQLIYPDFFKIEDCEIGYLYKRLVPKQNGHYTKLFSDIEHDGLMIDNFSGVIYLKSYNAFKKDFRYIVSKDNNERYSTERNIKAMINDKTVNETKIRFYIEGHLPKLILSHGIFFSILLRYYSKKNIH